MTTEQTENRINRKSEPTPWLKNLAMTGALLLLASPALPTADIKWLHLSSVQGDLPVPPGGSKQQTGALIGDFDGDGIDEFILSFRQKPPALAWYRRTATGWDARAIEEQYLTVEAGGAAHDIDGDGDLDIVFGGDWQSDEVWWWENPAPDFDRKVPWKRHLVKKGGQNQHHDQVFGDFLGNGKSQLAFWNQRASTLFLAEIPADSRTADAWRLTPILTNAKPAGVPYIEGASAFDIDADGKVDILACDSWFKHTGGREFKRVQFADPGGLIFAGYFKPSKYPQIVVSPGDGSGPVRLYECAGHPENGADWKARELLPNVTHGHSLQLGDVNRDGHLDIFAAEMAKWRDQQTDPDNPEATAWIFYGDGHGNLSKTELVRGQGWHEARLADLDGDGDLDLLNKPYTWEAPRVDVWMNNGTRKGAKGVGTGAGFHGPVGLQLYSLRDIFKTNVSLGLQFARNFGFREVELAGTYGMKPEQLRALLDRNGLKPIAAHFGYEQWAQDSERVLAEAKVLGVKYAGCAWIPHRAPFDEKKCRDAAEVFNRAGAAASRQGIRFFYHNHGYEFVKHGDGTLFDLLVKETRPEVVAFEMDVFWTVHPGFDPVVMLRKYPNRWELFHIKDMKKGTPTGLLTGSADVRNDVAVGTGQIDVAAALKAAQGIGVKHYFIEDESPSVLEQIPRSLEFLSGLEW